VRDVQAEVAEKIIAQSDHRAGGDGNPHILEGPFDKNLYIGASIGPDLVDKTLGSYSGTFGAHFRANQKNQPGEEFLLALTCDHVCFDCDDPNSDPPYKAVQPCLGLLICATYFFYYLQVSENGLDKWPYKLSKSPRRYGMITPSATDRHNTSKYLEEKFDRATATHDRLTNIDDPQGNYTKIINDALQEKINAETERQSFENAIRNIGVVFGTGGAHVEDDSQFPMDWGVIQEAQALDNEDLNKVVQLVI
jgi:hypothetical protein